MLNIKDRINFTKLRKLGPTSIDVKDNEVVELVSRGETRYVLDSKFFLTLLSSYEQTKIQRGLIPDVRTKHDPQKISAKINKELEQFSLQDNQIFGCAINNLTNSNELTNNLENFKDLNSEEIKFKTIEVLESSNKKNISIIENINSKNDLYLCYYMYSLNNIDSFFLVDISEDIINRLKSNEIDYNSLINSGKSFLIYSIKNIKGKVPEITIVKTSYKNLKDMNVIPAENIFFNMDNKLIKELDRLDQFIQDQKCEKLILAFNLIKKEITKGDK